MNNRTEVKQWQWHKQRTWRCGPRSPCPRGHAPCPRRDLPQFHCPSPPCPAWGWGGGGGTAHLKLHCWENFAGGYRKLQKTKSKNTYMARTSWPGGGKEKGEKTDRNYLKWNSSVWLYAVWFNAYLDRIRLQLFKKKTCKVTGKKAFF